MPQKPDQSENHLVSELENQPHFGNNFYLLFLALSRQFPQEERDHAQLYLEKAQTHNEKWEYFLRENAALVAEITRLLLSDEREQIHRLREEFTNILYRGEGPVHAKIEQAYQFDQQSRMTERSDAFWAQLNPLLKQASDRLKELEIPVVELYR